MSKRIALYIGDELFPNQINDPYATIATLHNSPLTTAILGCVNAGEYLVFNDGGNPNNILFDTNGNYVTSSSFDWGGSTPPQAPLYVAHGNEWIKIISTLKSGGNIREVYLSFGTCAVQAISNMGKTAAMNMFVAIRDTLGFDGIDLDYEQCGVCNNPNFQTPSPTDQFITNVSTWIIETTGLGLTASPYTDSKSWTAWAQNVQALSGTVNWLNLQCYSGGGFNDPETWTKIFNPLGIPVLAGTTPQCSPSQIETLYNYWVTNQGSNPLCCNYSSSTGPTHIDGGFMWAYSTIKGPTFMDYLYAIQNGLNAG